jgi:hypothetical protein
MAQYRLRTLVGTRLFSDPDEASLSRVPRRRRGGDIREDVLDFRASEYTRLRKA